MSVPSISPHSIWNCLCFFPIFLWFTERSEMHRKKKITKRRDIYLQFNTSPPAPDYTRSNSFDCSISKSIINCSIIKRVATGNFYAEIKIFRIQYYCSQFPFTQNIIWIWSLLSMDLRIRSLKKIHNILLNQIFSLWCMYCLFVFLSIAVVRIHFIMDRPTMNHFYSFSHSLWYTVRRTACNRVISQSIQRQYRVFIPFYRKKKIKTPWRNKIIQRGKKHRQISNFDVKCEKARNIRHEMVIITSSY